MFLSNKREWNCFIKFGTVVYLEIIAKCYLVNKPLQVAGMSADNVRGLDIVRKMNIWPKRANVKF